MNSPFYDKKCFSWFPATMFVPLKANIGYYENYDRRPKTPKAKTLKAKTSKTNTQCFPTARQAMMKNDGS